jgi:hypothetical protein
LARTFRDSKRFEDAERILLECRRLGEEAAATNATRAEARPVSNELADLYKAWGKPEEAARLWEQEGVKQEDGK